MIKGIFIRKSLCVLAAAGAVVGIGAALASASTVAVSEVVTPVDEQVSQDLGKSSVGVHIYNNTLGKMVLVAEGGDNAGLQPLGETLSPGTGYHDFEVVFRAAKKTTDYADYDIYDPVDNKIGSASINMTVDAIGNKSVKSTFTAIDGSTPLPLKTSGYSDGYQVVSSSSTPTTVDASSATAAALVDRYCDTVGTGATCSFSPSSQTPGTRMNLLALGYTQAGTTSGTVSVLSGYNASSSDSWSVSVSANTEIGGVFGAGIEASYGEKATWKHTFEAGDSIAVAPGYTGYIWGNVPVITYSGTMFVKLGNTGYDIQNVSLNTPDPSRALSDFYAGTWAGNDPLNSPSTPPTDAVALK